MTDLAAALRARIVADGPLRLDAWMAACNAHYYAGRDPFGAAGDFTTAPEISQMFGEIIGGWIGDFWVRSGQPRARLVELGAGRGTLMGDALRVLGRLPAFAGCVSLALVETSPALRAAQASRLSGDWFETLAAIPDDRPVIIVANEFFDALPVRQFLGNGHERAVGISGDGFAATTIPADGDVAPGERSAAGEAIAAEIGRRLAAHGGAALIIDYGHAGTSAVDSLQAVRGHATADPFADPGDCDLTAHVDFSGLAAAGGRGVRRWGPVPQGVWLGRLGIEARAAALKAHATSRQAAGIDAALVRLTAPTAMGALFKVMALTGPNAAHPAGFEGTAP